MFTRTYVAVDGRLTRDDVVTQPDAAGLRHRESPRGFTLLACGPLFSLLGACVVFVAGWVWYIRCCAPPLFVFGDDAINLTVNPTSKRVVFARCKQAAKTPPCPNKRGRNGWFEADSKNARKWVESPTRLLAKHAAHR